MSEKICPIFAIQIAIVAQTAIQAATASPNRAGMDLLDGLIKKEDKNCIRHDCAMWHKRGKRCGLIQGEL